MYTTDDLALQSDPLPRKEARLYKIEIYVYTKYTMESQIQCTGITAVTLVNGKTGG